MNREQHAFDVGIKSLVEVLLGNGAQGREQAAACIGKQIRAALVRQAGYICTDARGLDRSVQCGLASPYSENLSRLLAQMDDLESSLVEAQASPSVIRERGKP
uniref:hypothetical protein n=1 Tax=Rhodoferax sp. GW822-FHT02A01 TaxID=3141537 RepID=UPI00406CF423